MNLISIPERLGSSSVIVVGTAGIVAVLCGLFSLTSGLEAATQGASRDDRGLVLTKNAIHDFDSTFPATAADRLVQLENVKLVSSERLIPLRRRSFDGTHDAYLMIRGVDQNWIAIRSGLKILKGRTFEPGKMEIVVGRALLTEFPDLDVGNTISLYRGELTIVGIFESQGSLSESELFTDLAVMSDLYGGNFVQTVRIQMNKPTDFLGLQKEIDELSKGTVKFVTEKEVHGAHIKAGKEMIEAFASWILGIMAVGAIVASLATTDSAIQHRIREIATLRAIGFTNTPIVVSVLLEALFLAMIGSFFGALLVYGIFDGIETMTKGGLGSALVYGFQLTPRTVALGIGIALLLGLVGGLAAALRVTKISLTQVLNQK